MNETTQYNHAQLLPYANRRSTGATPVFPESSENTNNNGPASGPTPADPGEDTNGNNRCDYDWSVNDDGLTPSPGKYFRNPGVLTEVRQKDGFWLIGAGADRKFGTKDDQTNFGPIQ
jgi:hypothetical protein